MYTVIYFQLIDYGGKMFIFTLNKNYNGKINLRGLFRGYENY